jgi:hypothetical protein
MFLETGLAMMSFKKLSKCPFLCLSQLLLFADISSIQKLEPTIRLAELLQNTRQYVGEMDKTYIPVLSQLLDYEESDKSEQQQLLPLFQKNSRCHHPFYYSASNKRAGAIAGDRSKSEKQSVIFFPVYSKRSQ